MLQAFDRLLERSLLPLFRAEVQLIEARFWQLSSISIAAG
jgi:hypothetical protein